MSRAIDRKDTQTVAHNAIAVAVDSTSYTLAWPHAGYDLFKRIAGNGPAWLVTCNAHGTIYDNAVPVTSGPQGDKVGSVAGRKTWCDGCKA